MDFDAVSLDCWTESSHSIVQEGVGRPLPLTGASHTPADNSLGGPVDPVQVGTLGGWGSEVRSLFCLSRISHPCLGTVPRAGGQTSPEPHCHSTPSLPGSPIHSQALPPPSITHCSRYYPYVLFSLPPRNNGSSEREMT